MPHKLSLRCTVLAVVASFCIFAIPAAPAQDAVQTRITKSIDETRRLQLHGNTHPQARPEFDRGLVDPELPMESMILTLKRTPEHETALEQFMARQLDPASPDFHHWLSPRELGELYGPSDADITTITNWLQGHGFTVESVSNSRIFIEFSGTAALVQEAFRTEIHRYTVKGENHIANNADPSIPAALAPVVAGVFSLNNFFAKPLHRDLGTVRRDSANGKWKPDNPDVIAKPLFNVPVGGGTIELVAPYDFATIYNVLPLWSAGIDGTGQTIAIAGRSDISLTDVANFRSAFGLPANVPTIIVNGPDPGVPSADDKVENTLDVEWSGAVAKGATVKFVTTKSTATTDGAFASALYIIDNAVAPIMSYSYGACELAFGTAGNASYNSLWQQGATAGITEFVATGDQGAAACDGLGTPPYGAVSGFAVSGTSSTPYDTAVGGTDFQWANLPGTYWSSTNNSSNLSSVLGYIPEVPWNSTCVSDDVDQLIGATALGLDEEETCQTLLNDDKDLYLINVVGGTGGVSACTTPTSSTVASCSGGYAKPSWQTGTGVPADGKRDVPDLSLFASSGVLNSAYVICDSDTAPCTFSNATDASAQAVGGTSVASPAMAGIMALIVQKVGGTAQGLANPRLYTLAAGDNLTSCNSATVASGNSCHFYDITSNNNAVPCIPGSPNCTVHHTGDEVGVLNGYSAGTGFDLATGLGSVNASNLVNAWGGGTPSFTLGANPNALTIAQGALGTNTITVTGSGGFTGSVALSASGLPTGVTSNFSPSNTTSTSTLTLSASATATVGTVTVTITGKSGSLTETTTLQLTVTASTSTTVTLTPTSLSFGNQVENVTSTAKAVTLTNTGSATLNIASIAPTADFAIFSKTCGSTLAAGANCKVNVTFKAPGLGAVSGSLMFTDNASGSPQQVPLTGTGVLPALLSPATLNFPSQAVGTTGVAKTFTLTNNQTVALTGISVSTTGAFARLGGSCTGSLASKRKCTITVTFSPTTSGKVAGTLSVSDSAVNSPQSSSLTGTGIVPATLTPATATYPKQTVGTTSTAKTFSLTNNESVTLTGIAISTTGDFAKSATTCTASLASKAKCTISVTFTPTATGTRTGELKISDAASNSPQTSSLTGTGK